MGRGNVFLVGMMGAGKTTLGRALAQRLGLDFVDTDKVLVERTGVPVAGGGAILAAENRAVMRANGTVVYLRAKLESLWERTRHDATRPLLATPDPRATIARLLEQRDPLYQDAAHLVVDTGSQSAATLVGRVVAALRDHAAGARA